MRIAIAVEDVAQVHPKVSGHFGRCSGFYIYEFDYNGHISTKEFYVNPFQGTHNGNCQIPDYLQRLKVDNVIAGGMGRKAINSFNNYNIEVVTAPSLLVEEALHNYLDGELKGYEECREHANH